MKKRIPEVLLLALFLLLNNSLSAGGDVSLFLEPNANGTVYFKDSLAHLDKLKQEPYPNNQPNAPWIRVEYPGKYNGFVQTYEIDSSDRVKPGAYLFLYDNAASPVITIITADSNVVVMKKGDQWTSVSYEGPGYAYYKNPNADPAAQDLYTQDLLPYQPAGSNTMYRTAPQKNVLPARNITRFYEGRFVRLSGFDLLFARSDYEYTLENDYGQTIAYVVIDQALLFRPLEDYFDRQVTVEGTAMNINGDIPLVLHASFLRLK